MGPPAPGPGKAGAARALLALFGVQGWRWAWARDVRALVLALPPEAYGGCKDINAAWTAGALTINAGSMDATHGQEEITGAKDLQEAWEERTAIMVYDGHLPHSEAVDGAWAALVPHGAKS
jgi:hypothetical protein